MTSIGRIGFVGIAVALSSALACSNVDRDARVETRTSALTINQANVFGFEDPAHWSSSVALSSSTTHSQGSLSLGVAAKNYVEVTSVALPSLTGVSGVMMLDINLPTQQPNPSWYGFVQVSISVPSKGVNNVVLNTQELTGKPLNQFVPLDFNLPQSLVSTLQAGGYNDFKVKVILNVPWNATGTYRLDNLRFIAGAMGPTDLVETNILSNWTWGASDGATATLSVLTGSQAFMGQNALRAVTPNSGADFWLRYNATTPIDLVSNDYVRMAVRALNNSPFHWQVASPVFIVEDATGSRLTLTPDIGHFPFDGTTWVDLRAPLAGGAGWSKAGSANLHQVRALEIHTDTWDFGFTLDIDAVMFTKQFDTCSGAPASVSASATARATTATVTSSAVTGAIAYDIYRAVSGSTPTFLNRSHGTTFEDFGLAMSTTYLYEVRPVMPGLAGGCESGSAVATVTTAASATGLTRIPTLKIAVPIYINNTPSGPPYTSAEIAAMKAGVDLARQWYFRNTRGRLNFVMDYLEINAPTPAVNGSDMSPVGDDLAARGVVDNQYDGVFVMARDLPGCFGGFVILGHTAGAFGNNCGVPYPQSDPNVNTEFTWTFTHEFQHALDLVITQGSGQDMMHGHPNEVYGDMPYTGPINDAGEHFDWERGTLKLFTAYSTLAAPFNDYIEVADPDGDGLASNDARVPMDEARFASNANVADTDGDGLNDLGEYAAGMFGSSNPNAADTDGDGRLDNVDLNPRAAIAQTMTAKTPVIDGIRDTGYTLFRNGLEFTQVAGFTAATYIAYDANNFYVLAEMNQATPILWVTLDGSGANGFWQGDDTYSFTVAPGTTQVMNHTIHHGTEEPGVAITGSSVSTRTVGTTTTLEAKIPRALGQGFGFTGGTTTGFSTSVGTVYGFRITYSFGGAGNPTGQPWASVGEFYHFDDVTLQ